MKRGQEKSGVPQSPAIVWKVSVSDLNDSARTRYPKHAWEPKWYMWGGIVTVSLMFERLPVINPGNRGALKAKCRHLGNV